MLKNGRIQLQFPYIFENASNTTLYSALCGKFSIAQVSKLHTARQKAIPITVFISLTESWIFAMFWNNTFHYTLLS